MSDFTAAELVQMKAGLPRWGGFFNLQSDPVVALWLGVGDIRPGVNVVDTVGGVTYRGLGQLLDVPAFSSLCDGRSEKYSFSISGVPPTVFDQIAPLISEQQALITGKTLNVGYGVFGSDWSTLLGPLHWQFIGKADVLGVRMPVVESADAAQTWTLELTASDWLVDRRRSRRDYWTDQEHQTDHPGDAFFERMVLNSFGAVKAWPRF